MRARGTKKESDHNTIYFNMNIQKAKTESKDLIWKRGNEESWLNFNKVFEQKLNRNQKLSYEDLEKSILNSLSSTIGKKTIYKGKRKKTKSRTVITQHQNKKKLQKRTVKKPPLAHKRNKIA